MRGREREDKRERSRAPGLPKWGSGSSSVGLELMNLEPKSDA